MKVVSAGLILTNGTHFLGCKVTGQNFYDIPKGKIDNGETPLEACLREVKEETGLLLSSNGLVDLGEYSYIANKNLHLFLLYVENLPDIKNMSCISTFIHHKSGKAIPEINGYKYLEWGAHWQYMCKSMNNVLHIIEEKYISKLINH